MIIENIYLFFIYILFFYLILVTAIAIALFVALMLTVRKLNKQKIHLCLVNRDVFFNITFIDTPHFCGILSSYFNYNCLISNCQYYSLKIASNSSESIFSFSSNTAATACNFSILSLNICTALLYALSIICFVSSSIIPAVSSE